MKTTQTGFSLIEILVTIGILVVGLLGLAALQTQSTIAQMEAYQRSQALVLLQDLADRISVNKVNARSYATTAAGVSGAVQNCGGLTSAALDLCEWHNQLVGSAEVSGGRNVGAMIGARGCVVFFPGDNSFLVTVAWQGMSRAGTPVEACGSGAYGDDNQRRTVSTVVRVAFLNAK
jgi:type IV pilus assembly protein PilV